VWADCRAEARRTGDGGKGGRHALPRKLPHAGRKRNGAAQVVNGLKPLATRTQDSSRARRGQVEPWAWVGSRTGRGPVVGSRAGRDPLHP
jgi:hypothetical protein